MSLGVGAYKVGGAGQCSNMRRRYPWQPCERPPPGTVTLNNSVEYLPTNTYLAHTSRGREGWEKPKHRKARKQQQQAIATTLCEELQASNCVYKSRGAPARGIGPPLVKLGKLLTSIASRLTLPKLHLATLKCKYISNLIFSIAMIKCLIKKF